MTTKTIPILPPDTPNMSEIQIQAKAFQYLYNNYPSTRGLIFHVPNGGSRNKIEGMQLKASGVIPGIPDLLLINHAGQLAYIEVKTTIGYASSAQIGIHDTWRSVGIPGIIAYSSVEIVEFTISHFGLH